MIEHSIFTPNGVNETTLPIKVGGFVPNVLNTAGAFIRGRTSPLYAFNMVTPLLESYEQLKKLIAENRTYETNVSFQQQTDAFNELMIGFNIVWNHIWNTPIRTDQGLYIASKLQPDREDTIFDGQYFTGFEAFVEGYTNVITQYKKEMQSESRVSSFFHEIKEGSEFVGVGVSGKNLFSDVWRCNLIGIESSGRSNEATYSIIQRDFEKVIR